MKTMTVRCGLEEVNALKWDVAAAKVKKIYEDVLEEKLKNNHMKNRSACTSRYISHTDYVNTGF